MRRYAQDTSVSSDKSRAEIERTLARYGADQFMYGWREGSAVIAFRAKNRHIKFVLPLPDKAHKSITHDGRGRRRPPDRAEEAFEQACRQRWRALALAIKAKLEAVESGIAEFEEEFMAHIVLPSGETVGQWMRPQIESAYGSGRMPPLLEGPRGG